MSDHRPRARRVVALPVCLALGAFGLVLGLSPAGGAQFDVTNNLDAGAGSLRDAVAAAAAAAGDDDVVIQPGVGTINLASEILYDNTALGAITIRGNGATVVAGAFQALNNQSNFAMTIDGLNASRAAAGGDIYNANSSPLTVMNATVTAGGVNTASGALTIVNTTITGSQFGGVNTASGSIEISGSTVAANGSNGVNTAIGNMTIVNSTIVANANAGVNSGGGPVTLVYVTLTGNTNANLDALSWQSFGSVLAQPQGGPNCTAAATSNGYNFSDDASCGFTGTGDTQNGGDPLLGPLASNGGATQTRLPQAGSPLLDAIPSGSCQADGAAGVTTDQRGVTRPQGTGCDIGAVEVEVAVITVRFTG